jgi:hypothetical protein
MCPQKETYDLLTFMSRTRQTLSSCGRLAAVATIKDGIRVAAKQSRKSA